MSVAAIADGGITGGRKSRADFSRLCGFRGGRGAWRLESVSGYENGRVRLRVVRGGTRAGVVLKPGPSTDCYVEAGAIAICYEGRRADRPLAELMDALARRLKNAKPRELIEILSRDPESITAEPADASLAPPVFNKFHADPDAQCVSDRLGGNPGQWRRFFCGKEFERPFFWAHATGFVGRVLYFVHGDFDCTFMPPDVTFRGMTFLNYPPVHPHSADAPLPDTVYEQWTSDLKESDVVLGTAGKLDGFLGAVRSLSRRDDLVMISWSCTPTVIGDDEKALAAKVRKAGRCPVLINSINFRMRKSFSLFEELFLEVRRRPEFKRARAAPDAVNLLDCPPRFFAEELSPVLSAAGIRVNARVFPTIDIPSLDRYPAAAVQVLPEYFRGVATIRRAVEGLELETVFAPAPFGVEGTRRYVRAIARAFGREKEALAAWRKRRHSVKARRDELRREARGFRLAFVAEEGDIPMLTRPGFQAGVPVLRMLAEMGFGVDFLIYSPRGPVPAAAGALKRLPGFARAPAVRPFRSPEELGRLLARGGFRAVYSDIFFDRRITRAGKASFSMRDFEMGAEGALRALERLLSICRLPFYQRYRGYLARSNGDGGDA